MKTVFQPLDLSQNKLLNVAAGTASGDAVNKGQLDAVVSASVSGPVSSTDNALVRFDGTTGLVLQNSLVIADDLGNLSGLLSLKVVAANTGAIALEQWVSGESFARFKLLGDSSLVFGSGSSGTLDTTVYRISAGLLGMNTSNAFRVGDFCEMAEQNVAPSTPSSGFGRLYEKNDNTLHFLVDGGTDYNLLDTGSLISGVLPIARGGTGSATTSQNFALIGPTSGSGAYSFRALVAGDIPSLDAAKITTGALAVAVGGTGLSSYAVGDLLYASGSTTLAKLADVATGNALISGGVTTAPSWGKIALTTHISGTLPIANGGTNTTSYTTNGVTYYNGTSVINGAVLTFASGKAAITDSSNSAEATLDLDTAANGTRQTATSSGVFSIGTEIADLVITHKHAGSGDGDFGYPAALIDIRANNDSDEWSLAHLVGVVDANGASGWSGSLAIYTNPGGSSNPTGRRTKGANMVRQMLIDSTGLVTLTAGLQTGDNIVIATAGKGLRVKEGSNAKMGTAVLAGGTIVVSTTAVTATSRIQLTSQVLGGTAGAVYVSTRTAGTSFTIVSTSGTDTSTVAWLIVEPA